MSQKTDNEASPSLIDQAMELADVETFEELAALSDKQLKKVKGIGGAMVDAIRAAQQQAAAAAQPYQQLTYAGQPLYRCRECAFDTFHKGEILLHIALLHRPQPEPLSILLADKSGREVNS